MNEPNESESRCFVSDQVERIKATDFSIKKKTQKDSLRYNFFFAVHQKCWRNDSERGIRFSILRKALRPYFARLSNKTIKVNAQRFKWHNYSNKLMFIASKQQQKPQPTNQVRNLTWEQTFIQRKKKPSVLTLSAWARADEIDSAFCSHIWEFN